MVNAYREKHYAQIPSLPRAPPDDTDDTSGPDDPTDPDYKLRELRKRYTSARRRDESDLAKATDELMDIHNNKTILTQYSFNVYPWNHARRGRGLG